MDTEKEKTSNPSENIPWSQRSREDKLKYIGMGIRELTIRLTPPYQNDLNVNYCLPAPNPGKDYIGFASQIQEQFDQHLNQYLEDYREADRVDAMLDGSRCYIFPNSFEEQAERIGGKPINFVELKSLMFYFGIPFEQTRRFFEDFREFSGSAIVPSNPIVAAQVLAKELGKNVRVLEAVKREDGLIINGEVISPSFSPDPDYNPPKGLNSLERVQKDGEEFIVNEPQDV